MQPQDLKIVIIGGGVGGLGTAIALRRKGFRNVSVYERDLDATSRRQGYSFTLMAPVGGLGFFRAIDLEKEMDSIAFTADGFRLFDGVSGKPILEFTHELAERNGQAGKRVLRHGLRQLLVRVCEREGVQLHWNSKVKSYEEKEDSVVVHFENQADVTANVLIAADGINSVIRKQMIGDPVLYTGYTAIIGYIRTNIHPEVAEHPHVTRSGGVLSGPKKSVFFYHHATHTGGDILFGPIFVAPEGEIVKKYGDDKTKLLQFCQENVKDMCPLVQQMTQAVRPEDLEEIIDLKDREPLKLDSKTGRYCPSKSGLITLLGDAAHPMLPFQAAGGNNALIDAWKLSDQLATLLSQQTVSTADITRVLAAYEKEMGPRGKNAILGSRKAGEQFHTTSKAAIVMRNTILSMVSWKFNVYEKSKPLKWSVRLFMTSLVGAGLYYLVYRFKDSFVH